MARDNNIYVTASGGDARGAYAGGRMYTNKTTLSRQSGGRDDVQSVTQSNLRNILTVGLGFNVAQKLNETVGAYTNNRLRQRKIDMGMTFAKYGIGLAINPLAGATYLATDMAYRGIQYGIRIQKSNREANYYQRLSGNVVNSGSRYMGDYL